MNQVSSFKPDNVQRTIRISVQDDRNHALTQTANQCVESSQFSEVRRIRCKVEDGMLVLHGEVSSFYLKQLAQEAVRTIEGVTNVANHLKVTYPTASKSFRSAQPTGSNRLKKKSCIPLLPLDFPAFLRGPQCFSAPFQ